MCEMPISTYAYQHNLLPNFDFCHYKYLKSTYYVQSASIDAKWKEMDIDFVIHVIYQKADYKKKKYNYIM